MMDLNWGVCLDSVVDVHTCADKSEQRVLLSLFGFFLIYTLDCCSGLVRLCYKRKFYFHMLGKSQCFDSLIADIKFLHNKKSACVQVSKPEKHSALWFCIRVADVSRISAERTVSVENIAHDFNLEECLWSDCFNICRLPLVVPQEYFRHRVTSEVKIVRT